MSKAYSSGPYITYLLSTKSKLDAYSLPLHHDQECCVSQWLVVYENFPESNHQLVEISCLLKSQVCYSFLIKILF